VIMEEDEKNAVAQCLAYLFSPLTSACHAVVRLAHRLTFCMATNFLTNAQRGSVSTLWPIQVEAAIADNVIDNPRKEAGRKVVGYKVIKKR
jgi:hypothetical protein